MSHLQIDIRVLREGDVFAFAYHQAEHEKARGDLNWCFDGQLVYRGGDRLVDTYWGLERSYSEGRAFTVEEAQARGTLRFVCNLADVEKIQPHEYELYADGDAFNLSHQHGCYKHYVRRKGAKKDRERMTALVHRRVREAHDEVERAARNLEWRVVERERALAKIAAGEEIS